MKVTPLLDQPCTQADFAEMVGVSEARISQLAADGVIPRGETAHAMLLAYCERLRDQAAGRAGGEMGGLDLVQERAALAREQRQGLEIKNAALRGEYAPIGLLSDVLGRASSAMVDRFDQIEGTLRKTVPDISDEVLMSVLGVVAAARNECIRATSKLIDESIDRLQDQEDDGDVMDALSAFAPDDRDGIFEGATL